MTVLKDNDDLLLDYCRDVQSGAIASCKQVIRAVDRFLDDLKRSESDACPFYWDSESAANAADWFPAFLVHTEGEYAGQPFELADFQRFLISNIFGFRLKASGLRRFREVLLQVARGNGKSPLCAGLLLYGLAFDNEARSQCYCAATKRDQARIVFDEVGAYIGATEELRAMLTVQGAKITTKDGSKLTPLSSDGKTADGFRPHFVCRDEMHAWRGQDGSGKKTLQRELYEKLNTAMAKRTQPLSITATTAGDEDSDIWLEEDGFARAVLGEVVQADHLLVYIAEIDDEDSELDEICWPKANPLLESGVVKIDALRSFAKRGEVDKAKRREFRRYHCNRLTSSVVKPITGEDWNASAGELPDLAGQVCYAGFDWGTKSDLSALAFVFPIGSQEVEEGDTVIVRNEYAIRADVWIPEGCERDLTREPWAGWIEDDLINVTGGDETDLGAIIKMLRQRDEEYAIQSCVYDKHNAAEFRGQLDALGIGAEPFAQSFDRYHEPMREFIHALRGGRIAHGGDPLLGWCATNLASKTNASERSMPSKRRSGDKIDPIVALIMATSEAMFAAPPVVSVYEERGMIMG